MVVEWLMAPEVAVTIIVLLPIGVPDDLLELPPQALSERMQKSASSRLAAPKRSARVLATLANGRRRVTSRSSAAPITKKVGPAGPPGKKPMWK